MHLNLLLQLSQNQVLESLLDTAEVKAQATETKTVSAQPEKVASDAAGERLAAVLDEKIAVKPEVAEPVPVDESTKENIKQANSKLDSLLDHLDGSDKK